MTAVKSASKRSKAHADETRRDRVSWDGAIATASLDLESAIAIATEAIRLRSVETEGSSCEVGRKKRKKNVKKEKKGRKLRVAQRCQPDLFKYHLL